MDSVHYKIILIYKGSAFGGFQYQENARTVQGELEAGLRKLGWQGSHILAAGRTDAGVHARGQVVSFHLKWQHSTEDLRNALNHHLPQDIGVMAVSGTPETFHPRYDAKCRHYRYRVYCQPHRDPLRDEFAWRVWPEPDCQRMNEAASLLVGIHDFAAFGSPTSEGGATIREVFSAHWQKNDDEYQFDIQANAYLYHMVRRITFLLVNIGQGSNPVEMAASSLESGELIPNGLAPAQGLVLQKVVY